MFSYKYPVFERGRVLKLEMLDYLRDIPINFIDTFYGYYSDGIINGFNVTSEDNIIIISKGIIKFNGKMYVLNEDISIVCDILGENLVLKIRFYDTDDTEKDFAEYKTEILFDTEFDLNENDIEICRFDLREGAKLRFDYVDLYDMTTQYDTVNLINVLYSGYNYPTISPKITRFFATEALKLGITEPIDISFCMMCINGDKALDIEVIKTYISNRLGVSTIHADNNQIFKFMCKIFDNIKNNNKAVGKRKGLSNKTIIVD